jgi:hypothetical protein
MRAGRAGLHLSQAAVERSETTRAFALAVGVSVTASAPDLVGLSQPVSRRQLAAQGNAKLADLAVPGGTACFSNHLRYCLLLSPHVSEV